MTIEECLAELETARNADTECAYGIANLLRRLKKRNSPLGVKLTNET